MFGHLAANESTAGLATTVSHTFNELINVVRVESTYGDVVEKKQWLSALTHEIVDTHRNEIDTDCGESPRCLSNEGFRADTVS
ncbi:unannotated protein [freshwater metagenome]|uniref:Unannotated protein n=1 Tax=freshwater metagenome TaxID=449393 RepID=A0A6J6L153_9ZZZZ